MLHSQLKQDILNQYRVCLLHASNHKQQQACHRSRHRTAAFCRAGVSTDQATRSHAATRSHPTCSAHKAANADRQGAADADELAAVVRQQQILLALAQGLFGANQQDHNNAYN